MMMSLVQSVPWWYSNSKTLKEAYDISRRQKYCVSISPSLIDEFKPGIYPGHFVIAPCLNDSKPERLVIGASEHLMFGPGGKEATN